MTHPASSARRSPRFRALAFALFCSLAPASALWAAPDNFYVADHKDAGNLLTGSGTGNTGDLRYCVVQANASTNPEGSVINIYDYPTLVTDLPPITRTVTIQSDPNIPQTYAVSGGYVARLFFIDAPTNQVVRIKNLVLKWGRAKGGNGGPSAGGGAGLGGGIFVNSGQVVLENVEFIDCGVTGGTGGNQQNFMGGGGGGLGGNGGAQGGGGGGFRGNGGNGGDNNFSGVAGGGGGGLFGNGASGGTNTGQQSGGGGGGTINASGGSGQGGGGNGGANNSSPGIDGTTYGGGGGGGAGSNNITPAPLRTAGNGGKFGGGGGGSTYSVSAAGHGGAFGGGGGGLYLNGGNGGYGGGGGGAGNQGSSGGTGGFGGGNGRKVGPGDGGSAYGAVIFVRGSNGAGPVTILEGNMPVGSVIAGPGGTALSPQVPGSAGSTGGTSIFHELGAASARSIVFEHSGTRTLDGTLGSDSQAFINLTKRGAGTLLLQTPHTYMGLTQIEAGTVRLAPSGGNLGSTSGLTLVDGTLDLNGNSFGTGSMISVNGGVVTTSAPGNLTVTISHPGANSTYRGVFQDGAGRLSLVKDGPNEQYLTGQSTHTGGTTVNAGLLGLNAPNSNFGALGLGDVTINGGQILVLGSNAFMGFSGASPNRTVRINAGATLRGAAGASNHLAVNLILAGGTLASDGVEATFGSWNLDRGLSTPGGGFVSNITGGNLSLGLTGGTIFNIGNGDTLNVSAVLDHLLGDTGLRKQGPGTLVLNGLNTYTGGTTVEAGKLVLGAGGGTGAIRGTLTVNAGTTVEATVGNSFGFLPNAKIDFVTLNGGTIVNSSALDLGWGVDYTLNGGTLSSNGGVASATAGSKFSFGGPTGPNAMPAVKAVAASTTTIAGRVDLRSDNGNVGTTFNVDTGATLNLTAAVTTSGTAQTLTKTGAGTLTLSGPNTYVGETVINAGILAIGSPTALGTSTLRFTGGTLRFLNTNTDVSGSLLAASASTFQFDTNGQNVNFATAFGGTQGLTKSGAGTLTLSAANTYSGITSLVGGELGYANASAFGSSTLTFNGGTLKYVGLNTDLSNKFNPNGNGPISVNTNGQDVTFGTALTNGFGLTKSGAGRLILSLQNLLSGTTTLAGGNVRILDGNRLGSTRITFAGGTLEWQSGFSADLSSRFNSPSSSPYSIDPGPNLVEVNATLAGTGGFTKAGPAGIVLISGNNTFTGPTTIEGGILQVGYGSTFGSLGTPSAIVNNGTLIISRSDSFDLPVPMTGTGAFTVMGSGLVSVVAGNTATGAVQVNGSATLRISPGASLLNLGTANSSLTLSAGTKLQIDGNDFLGNDVANPNVPVTAGAGALIQNSGTYATFKNLNLNGAELRANGGFNNDYPAYQLKGTVTVGGSTPSLISATGSANAFDLVNLTANTIFDVADATGSNAADLTISARLKNSVTSAGRIFKLGAGTLLLTAANSFSGPTTINAGTLALGAAGTLGTSASITVASGAQLDVSAKGTAGFNVAAGRTLTNDGTVTGVIDLNGSYVGTGVIDGGLTVNAGVTLTRNASESLTVAGTLVNNGTIRVKSGTFNGGGLTSIVNNGLIDLINASPSSTLPTHLVSGTGIVLPPGGVAVKNAVKAGSTVTVTIDGYTQHTYQLQRSTSLASDTFVNVGTAQSGVGTTAGNELTFTDNSAPVGAAYYRVVVQ